MHPFKGHADKSQKDKMSSLGGHHKSENDRVSSYLGHKHIASSHSSEQHREQAAAPGFKKGGRTSHKRGHKLPDFARGAMDQAPPSPDLSAAQAGTGASPSPVPAPSPMMQKRGGRVHSDVTEDKALIKKMVKPAAIKKADGGRISPNYPLKKGGSDSGVGRLEKAHKKVK